MKHFWKRLLACALTLVMLLGMTPPAAYAAVSELVTRSGVENAALLEALREVYGDDAEAYLAVLEQYGLIDEDGNFVTDEKIVMDGVEYTLDEIEAILNAPDTDLSKVVEVDGTHLTLEELKTIVEIERYLAYVKAAYFTQQDLTDEQIDSFYDLADAWASGEVQMLSARALTGVGPAGVDHSVRLTVEAEDTASENNSYTVTVTPNKAQTEDITFSWRAVSGSADASGGGDVTIPAGSTEPVTLTVDGITAADRTQGDTTFLVQLYNLKNALFDNRTTRWQQTVTVAVNDDYCYYYERSDTLGIMYYADSKSWYTNDFEGRNDRLDNINPDMVQEIKKGTPYVNTPWVPRNAPMYVTPGDYILEFSGSGVMQEMTFGGRSDLHPYVDEVGMNAEQCARLTMTFAVIDSDRNPIWDSSDTYTYIYEADSFHNKEAQYFDTEWTGIIPVVYGCYLKFTCQRRGYYLEAKDGTALGVVPYTEADLSYTMHENTLNASVAFSVPAGTYYAGQSVPITAAFDYPVHITEDMTITVNGETLSPAEVGTTSEQCTFLYPVTRDSGASVIITDTSFVGEDEEHSGKVTGANELVLPIANPTGKLSWNGMDDGVAIQAPDRWEAFDWSGAAAELSGWDSGEPLLRVTIPLVQKYANWLLQPGEVGENNEVNAFRIMTAQLGDETFPLRVDSDQNPTMLTAEIPVPLSLTEEDTGYQVCFYLDGDQIMGRTLGYTMPGSTPLTTFDFLAKARYTFNGETKESENPYGIDPRSEITLFFEIIGEDNYTWGDTTKVTCYNVGEEPEDLEKYHFAWVNEDPDKVTLVLNEDKTVTMLVNDPATMSTYYTARLLALNGGMKDAKEGINFYFERQSGDDEPYLRIPLGLRQTTIRAGEDLTVNWTSNICQKNTEKGKQTTFTVALYSAGEYDSPEPEPVHEWTVTTDAEHPIINSFTVPWQDGLKTLYDQGERVAMAGVSTMYDNGFGEEPYGSYWDEKYYGFRDDASAVVTMLAPAAYVTLDKPADGLYQLDGGKDVTLTWQVPNLDTTPAGGGKFELYIAGGALEYPIVKSVVGDNSDGKGAVSLNGDTYSYTFQVPEVRPDNDPTSYRDSYSITVKAKNNAEATWASDSYVLYVYDRDVLDILVDHGNTETTGGSHTMSNVDKIKKLWGGGGQSGSDAIVALQRDIALKNVISINYGQYAWATLADQIQWNSSDTSVATVNYQQGTLYENIENFSYVSYRPSTDFILSGLEEGSTTVTATHAKLPKITDSLTVNVETLRDQLYLFQCYPKAKTSLDYTVYTNASRTATEKHTLDTNEKGEAAIYAPYGIAGDIYCKSETTEDNNEKVTWLGIIYNRNLVSSEADSTKLQLYPVNTFRLRRAAQAEIYLKNPDGTPYVGQVTFRGGVYRQGEYCTGTRETAVKFDLENKPRDQWQTGDVPQTVPTDSKGRLLVTMDLMQFKTAANQTEVQAGEKLYYLFQLEYGDGSSAACYPIMLRVDANLNLDDIAATGDSIVAWEKNENKDASGNPVKVPYIVQQTLKYSPSPNASVANIRRNTGSVGPSATFPTAYVTTSVMWWGDGDAREEGRVNAVHIQDTTGKTPACQISTTTTYPFSDLAFTENVMTMDESARNAWGVRQGEKRGVQAVFSKDGITTSRTVALPFQIVNMTGVVKAEDSEGLTGALKDVKSSLTVDAGESASNAFDKMSDGMLGKAMQTLKKDTNYDPSKSRDTFAVRLYATSDPTVFRALFCVSGGNMSSDDNVTGVYPEYGNMEDMAFVSGFSTAENTRDVDTLPNPLNVYKMLKGTYMDSVKAEGRDAMAGKKNRSFNMDLGGYMEADIAYNSETKSWECRPINGGFHVGGGVNFTWNFNAVVGIIPVTASLTLGGTLEVRLDMQQGHY